MFEYSEHTVTYDTDRSIFYLEAGPADGPLVIFMHGWPGIAKTWHPQLQTFASLGFRVVAPDMPGYGQSTARPVHSDYRQELIVEGMLAVLADTGCSQAVWIGHDWGCGTLWALANTHPEVCRAAAGLCVPYGVLEIGLETLLATVDRELYPEAEYPYGQWSYMVFYEQSFDKAVEYHDRDIAGFLRAMSRPGKAEAATQVARTANVMRDGGWFGGKPVPTLPEDLDETSLHGKEVMRELIAAMQKTGFGPGDAWYMNHKANSEFNVKATKHDGKLKMPVHFIHAAWDAVCLTTNNAKLAEPMRQKCEKLTESVIEAGHWVAAEKSEETNAALVRWIVQEVEDWWPAPKGKL